MQWISKISLWELKSIKYWCKLLQKSPDSIVRKAYDLSVSLHNGGFKSWASNVFDILKSCKLEDIFENPPNNEQIVRIPMIVKKNLEDMYKSQWSISMNRMSKLESYCMYKINFGFEPYLYLYNKGYRQALSRFRMSSHTLEIEGGRWRRKEREERICLYCTSGSVESEIHALLHCSKHNRERLEFLEHIERLNLSDIIESKSYNELFCNIMSSNDPDVLHVLSKFISNIFRNRLEHDEVQW